MRDGRLAGVERVSFERHLAKCAECAAEAARLDELAVALRKLHAPLPDVLRIRRRRQALLAELDRATLTTGSRPSHRDLAASILAALISAVLVTVALRAWRSPQRAPAASSFSEMSTVQVGGNAGARWSLTRQGKLERVRIDEGTVRLRIRHAAPDEQVVLLVPDGEIEDRGTALTISVSSGFTQRIAVDEGAVRLRLRDTPERVIEAGQSWSRAVGSAPSTPDATSELAAASASGTLGARSTPDPVTARAPQIAGPSWRAKPAAARSRPSLPSSAMARPSAEQFAPLPDTAVASQPTPSSSSATPSSSGASPSDRGHAEDAAYLTVMRHLRAGRTEAARAATRDYLAHFPDGFRAPELRDIAK